MYEAIFSMLHHTFAEQLECVLTRHAVRSLIYNYMAQGIAASVPFQYSLIYLL